MQKTERKNLKDVRGITLLALVITIVIILILAGISVGALTGDNGLISNAIKAKEQSEIDEEKEILNTCTTQAMGKHKYGSITKDGLQSTLDDYVKDEKNKAKVLLDGNDILVEFIDRGRYYYVDNIGNVDGPQIKPEIEYAGDITKNGKYDGNTLESAYQVTCIEDLVAFSNMVNGTGYTLDKDGNAISVSTSTTFGNKYIVLTRDLSFTSPLSYNDCTTTKFGNINGDENTDELITELSTGTGFTPIGNGSKSFQGNFLTINNEKHTIKNIYQYTNGRGGLFGYIENATIENIGLTGNITSTGDYAGGIVYVAQGSTQIINCYNQADIVAEDRVTRGMGTGGIVGSLSETGVVKNCYNTGNVTGNSMVGGICRTFSRKSK